MPSRYNQFRQNRGPYFPPGVATPPPAVPESVARDRDKTAEAKQRTEARYNIALGFDSSWCRQGFLEPVRFAGVGLPADILTFQVPQGRILVLRSIQFTVSEPLVLESGQMSFRLASDGGRVPFWDSAGLEAALAAGASPVTDLSVPVQAWQGTPVYTPLAFQANSTVRVQIIQDPLQTNFVEYLVAATVAYGELYKPAGGVIDG